MNAQEIKEKLTAGYLLVGTLIEEIVLSKNLTVIPGVQGLVTNVSKDKNKNDVVILRVDNRYHVVVPLSSVKISN